MADKRSVTDRRVEAAKEFLCSYNVCAELLGLRRYERKRARMANDEPDPAIFEKDEIFWKTRMIEVQNLLGSMKNGREKVFLYYRFMRGESVERISDLLGFSRRTGYRALRRGLERVGLMLERMK